jgi:hypothetical protein
MMTGVFDGRSSDEENSIFHSFDLLHQSLQKLQTHTHKKKGKAMKCSAGYNNSLLGYFLIQIQQWPHKIRIPRKHCKCSINHFHIILPLFLNRNSKGSTVMHTAYLL